MSKTPKLLLCVEDDEDDCKWIEEAALDTDPELQVTTVPNGREALRLLHKLKEQDSLPCLMLLDINMPVMDGRQTLSAIKQDPDLRHINIIVFLYSSICVGLVTSSTPCSS